MQDLSRSEVGQDQGSDQARRLPVPVQDLSRSEVG